MQAIGFNPRYAALALALAAAGGAGVYYLQRAPDAPARAPAPMVLAPPDAPAQEQTHFPIEQVPVATPAVPVEPPPTLEESDAPVADLLARLLGADSLAEILIPQHIIPRIVATIDNLPRSKLALQAMPVKPAGGRFLVGELGAERVLDQENFARYEPYVRLFENVDVEALVAQYVRLYPLFQRAYRELGYPDAYFNDRLIQVIDHLLAAPVINTPIELVQPHVFWEFADPELEARSTGQKLMIRMGPQRGERVKVRLREFRHALTGHMPASG